MFVSYRLRKALVFQALYFIYLELFKLRVPARTGILFVSMRFRNNGEYVVKSLDLGSPLTAFKSHGNLGACG